MSRDSIIDIIGSKYRVKSIGSEHGEFHYEKELKAIGKDWDSIKIKSTFDNKRYYKFLDLRFVNEEKKVSVCVETKTDIRKKDKELDKIKEQLDAYMQYEKHYSGNTVVGILASTDYDDAIMYLGSVAEEYKLSVDCVLSMDEICKLLFSDKKNSKEKVMTATHKLNEMLNTLSIEAKIRSQFVGSCLLALKLNLDYYKDEKDSKGRDIKTPRTADSVIAEIKSKLKKLLDDTKNKDKKVSLLSEMLENERIRKLEDKDLFSILNLIDTKILPSIDDETTAGQDILNLFFTTFNKYVDKDDKNQAFTPDHITEFMCKITEVNRDSVILDPCCGSGSFLVRAIVTARNDCKGLRDREERIDKINKEQIYGIECSEKPYGLATTNMLIHSDGNSNIKLGNCFEESKFIVNAKPTVILMNPPYNAARVNFPQSIVECVVEKKNKKGKVIIGEDGKAKTENILKTYCYEAWPKGKDGSLAKEDPTKGLCFVDYISDCLREANLRNVKLAVLVPLQCAISNSGVLLRTKENLLKYNTLEAVFSLPSDLFYPGASANVCCMLFNMGVPHIDENGRIKRPTFFGYCKEDGFKTKKYLGRVEQFDSNGNSIWKQIEEKWLDLYLTQREEPGFSAVERVNASDEWLCEAYMKTDYSNLSELDFQKTLNNYLAYCIKEGNSYEFENECE